LTKKIRLLANDELRWNELPNTSDVSAIMRFAMSFNSYMHFEPFDFSPTKERERFEKSDTLTYTRHVLFMYARASAHQGSTKGLPLYQTLLPIFQHCLPDAPPRKDKLEDHLAPLFERAGINKNNL